MYRLFILFIACSLSSCSFFSSDFDGPAPPPLNAREQKIIDLMSSLPRSPTGYSWITYQGIALLTPNLWFEYKNNKSYISSPKRLTKTGFFATGLTIQTLRDIQKTSGVTAETATIRIIKILEQKKTNKRLFFNNRTEGNLKIIRYRYLDSSHPKYPFIVHMHFIVSNSENFVKIIKFKSPADSFKKNWTNHGILIFKRIISIDDF